MNRRNTNGCILSVMLAVCLLLTACGESAAASVMQLMKTEGAVGVSDGEGKALSPVENMMLYSGYQMETSEKSYAWINLDSVKLTKMDAESEIEVRKDGKQLEILVNCGRLYFNITEPLSEDETLNIRTSTMAVGIRGTCGWVEVADQSHMRVYILEGTVQCGMVDLESGEIQTVDVSGGEMAEITLSSENEGDKYEIRKEAFTEYDIPGFVRNEVIQDEALLEKIYEASGLSISDELSPQTYLELADTQIQQGEYDKAMEILQQGLETSEDNEEIKAKIEELENADTVRYEAPVRRYYSYYAQDALRYYMEYTFDEQGRQNSVATYMENGEEISRGEILYDEQGHVIQDYSVESGDGRMGRTVYEYDMDGNLSTLTSYSATGTFWAYNTYAYDTAGNLIKVEQYNTDGSLSGYTELAYDADNNLVREAQNDADGNLLFGTEYEYDAAGNPIKENDFRSDGSSYTSREFEYDADGNQTKENNYNSDGTLSFCTEYEYDARGNVIREIFDSSWNTYSIVYEYDANGNKIKSTQYDRDGNMTSGGVWEYL